MLSGWFATPALRRVLQNFVVLASGRAAGGGLGFMQPYSARARWVPRISAWWP